MKLKKQEMADDDVIMETETSRPTRKRRKVRISQLDKEIPNKNQRLSLNFTKGRQEEIKASKGVHLSKKIPITTNNQPLGTDFKTEY